MITNQSITKIAQPSLQIKLDEAARRNVYECDLALWGALKKLADQQPELASRQFQIKPETAKQIAQADEAQLQKLASGVLFSFQLCTPEKILIDCLNKPSPLLINNIKEDFNILYWFILNQMAINDIKTACICFGISLYLAEAMAQANCIQLRQLAHSAQLQFSMRCTEQSILDCLAGNDSMHTFIKKHFTILKKSLL